MNKQEARDFFWQHQEWLRSNWSLSPEGREYNRKFSEALLAIGASEQTFEEAWAEFEAAGFQYGEDALDNVRLGFEIARGRKPE